jgi:hypothetical protein
MHVHIAEINATWNLSVLLLKQLYLICEVFAHAGFQVLTAFFSFFQFEWKQSTSLYLSLVGSLCYNFLLQHE